MLMSGFGIFNPSRAISQELKPAGSPHAAANPVSVDDDQVIVGTWVGVVFPGDGQTFPSLLTFHADGTASFSAAGPPVPGLGNPGHGAWKKIGPRTSSEGMWLQKLDSIIEITGTNTFSTKDTVTIYDLNGNPIVTLKGSQRARRLEVTIP
jgi:hypothetical protein